MLVCSEGLSEQWYYGHKVLPHAPRTAQKRYFPKIKTLAIAITLTSETQSLSL